MEGLIRVAVVSFNSTRDSTSAIKLIPPDHITVLFGKLPRV
ncbi:MAG TPA: hypothetical protein VEB88_01600 [Candidatus Acidoferrales bacterium]|nr:hypothetical protein [Candidatus Acidoferrales bacterium]